MNLRGLLSLVLATATPSGIAYGQPSYHLTSTAFGSVGGVAPGSPFNLGMTAGQSVTGPARSGQLAEMAGFWRWGRLPVLDADDPGTDRGAAAHFYLSQNAPNPFGHWTVIRFGVPATGGNVAVSLRLYDLSSRLVRVLDSGPREPGTHAVTWDGRDDGGLPVGSGIYFCRIEAGPFRATRRIVLMR